MRGKVALILLVHTATTIANPSLIPSPNVCSGVSSSSRVFSIWESSDCPLEALCIPYPNNGSFCSCKIGPGVYDEQDRQCVLSTASYVFISLFAVLSVCSFCLVLWGCWEIRRAVRLGQARKDFILALGVLSTLCMVVQTISTAILAAWTSTLSNSTRAVLWFASSVVLVILGILVLMVVVVFGFSVLQFAINSVKVRVSNQKRTTRLLLRVVGIIVLLLVGAAIPLVKFRQSEFIRLLWGLAAFFGALFYHYTLGWVLQLATFGDPKENPRVKQAERSIKAIKRLSFRLLIPLTTYAGIQVLHSVCVFVGRKTRNKALLGPIVLSVDVIHNAIVCIGIGFVIKYFRSATNARSMVPINVTAQHLDSPRSSASKRSHVSQPPEL